MAYRQNENSKSGKENQKEVAENDSEERLRNALASIGTTDESMSSFAGGVLQIAKQVLSMRSSGKPVHISGARNIGSQSIIEVIWEGRNHAMHWDEGVPHRKVKDMLDTLSSDLKITIVISRNNCLSILGALGWKSADDMVADLKELNQ